MRWRVIMVKKSPLDQKCGNYGIQGVREGLLVTLVPRRGQWSALARRYKRRLDTHLTHLVYNEVIINKLLFSYFVNFYSTVFLQLSLSRELIRLTFSIERYSLCYSFFRYLISF